MKVILLKDIEDLGKKYDVKEVKNGYARNFLIPKGLAKIATKESLEEVKTKKEIEKMKAEEELLRVQKIASNMDGQEITISVKVGEEGQLFESVTVQKIYEQMKKMGFDVKKKQIELTQSIKSLGEFPIKIKFEHNLEAEVTLIITEEI